MRRQRPRRKITIDSSIVWQTAKAKNRYHSLDLVKRDFASAKTLGADEKVRVAADSALEDAGIFGLIQHSINLGQMPQTSFMGYAALQQIQQNSLIRTMIQVPSRDMMAAGFELQIDRRDSADALMIDPDLQKEQGTETISRILEVWGKHDLNAKLEACLRMDGFEGGAFLFIDTGAQGEELQVPLDISSHSSELSADRPLKFKVVDPINVFPGTYNASDPLEDYYFDPQLWWVLGTKVHASRLIKFAANEVPLLLKPAYNFLGIPQAQLYWDYVLHWNQNRESANRLLNKFSLLAIKTNMAEALNGGLIDDLNRRMDYLATKRSNDGVLVLDKESEDAINIATPLSGVTDIVKQSLEWLAVVSHIPAVVLFGQSPQGFNATGESDLNNYSNLIESRREAELRGPIETLVEILRIHDTDCKDPVTVNFLPFDTSKSQQNAQTELIKAQAAAAHIQAGITSAEEERQKLANDKEAGYQFIDIEDVPDTAGTLPDDFMDEMQGLGNGEETPGIAGNTP